MPAICLCYEVHEPYRLRHYTVFDMGQNSIYEDDDRNCDLLLHTARVCYLPMNDLVMRLIRRYGKDFRLTYCISGTALDQFEQYAPEVLESFQALAETEDLDHILQNRRGGAKFCISKVKMVHVDVDTALAKANAKIEQKKQAQSQKLGNVVIGVLHNGRQFNQ